MSINDAISTEPAEPSDDVRAWQMRKLKERQQRADDGNFASVEAVRAVIRKFIPNG